MAIPENKALTTIPGNITYEQAAANTEGAHYAYNFIKKANLKVGKKFSLTVQQELLVQQQFNF